MLSFLLLEYTMKEPFMNVHMLKNMSKEDMTTSLKLGDFLSRWSCFFGFWCFCFCLSLT